MSKKKKPPLEGWRKSYLQAIAVLASTLPMFEKADAAKKIKNIRVLLIGAVEDPAAWERDRLAELNAKADLLDNLDHYINHVEATKILGDSYSVWERNKCEECLRFIQDSLDIRYWHYASQGVEAVITVCRYTPGLGDFGHTAFSQLVTEGYEQKGSWYELQCRAIESDTVTDIEAWQDGLYAMKQLMKLAKEAAEKNGIRSPFPTLD